MSAESTGHHLRTPDGRRTRIYTTLEAAQKAAARGELYTDAEYAALTAIASAPRKKKPR